MTDLRYQGGSIIPFSKRNEQRQDRAGLPGGRIQRLALRMALATILVVPGAAMAAPQDVSSVLKAKTQAFSDAGQNGAGRTMAEMLDDGVTFFNENGDVSTKADISTDGPPPADGVRTRMTVEDWNCRLYGNVAITSFIDDQIQDFHGQNVHARFRSVETWMKADDDWKMIASATVALYDDPRGAVLPIRTLDEYVGTYRAAPDMAFVVSRDGEALMASTNGGPKTRQAAEIKDVFFTPGRPRYRKLFQRDGAGRVTGFVYRHEGHDILFTKVSA